VGEGLLAQQGLRTTQAGGHLAVVAAVRAQFGGNFTKIDTLRRRRHELEYPSFPGEHVEPPEVAAAIDIVRKLLADARQLAGHLSIFTRQ